MQDIIDKDKTASLDIAFTDQRGSNQQVENAVEEDFIQQTVRSQLAQFESDIGTCP